MIEQLRALWGSRDKEQAFVRGTLLTRSAPKHGNGLIDASDHMNSSSSHAQLEERWFTLIGHSLFYCKHKDASEYTGALLTDIFSPVIARVSKSVMDDFQLPEEDQVKLATATLQLNSLQA